MDSLERLDEDLEQLTDTLRDLLLRIKQQRDGFGTMPLAELEARVAGAAADADWAADIAVRANAEVEVQLAELQAEIETDQEQEEEEVECLPH
jgi:hypothetical protein